MLNQALLESVLNQDFQYFDSVDSTNDIAQTWLRNGADSLAVVIADEQRKGRGRRGRVWYTPPHVAIAISVIMKPKPHVASRVSMIGCLAVYDLCRHLNIDDVAIKWPNDVQIMGKKVSGVLPEAVWEGDSLLGVVLGIGINVRNNLEIDIKDTAITLEIASGRALNRVELIAHLLERLAYWYSLIEQDDLLFAWKTRLNTLNQHVTISGNNLHIVGQAVDVDSDGALLIKTGDGSIHRVMAGDVSLRPQG